MILARNNDTEPTLSDNKVQGCIWKKVNDRKGGYAQSPENFALISKQWVIAWLNGIIGVVITKSQVFGELPFLLDRENIFQVISFS